MSTLALITDQQIFTALWERATTCARLLEEIPPKALLHFDSSNIGTRVFRRFIRELAEFNGNGEFALIVLDPDPFSYFHFHFGKYPGLVVDARHSDDEFFDALFSDPGDSPADAIGFYSEKYVILPTAGDWFMYADRGWDGGTGVLTGPPDLMQLARASFAFYENPG